MTLVFRNYVPKQESLRGQVQKTEGVPSRDEEVLLNNAKKNARLLPSNDDPILVAPKRANWDLKKDVEKRLKKLAKRTQVAIAELAEELNADKQSDEE